MKNLKSILVVVCMLGALLGYASGEPKFSLVEGTKKVKVVFDNVSKGDVLIVRNSLGRVFHKEALLHDGKIFRVFDFSTLKDGNYEIDLNREMEILRKPFAIRAHTLFFKKDIKTLIHKPLIEAHDDIVEIKDLYTEEDSAEVIILFNDHEILNEELDYKSDHLCKKYKLDKFESGLYKVIVHSEGKSYVKEFKI